MSNHLDQPFHVNRYTEIAYALINILRDNGGKGKKNQPGVFNIYDRVADYVGLSAEERSKKTRGGESALRATVGYVKLCLKNERIISDIPGEPGVWTLQEGHQKGLVWLMTMSQSDPSSPL